MRCFPPLSQSLLDSDCSVTAVLVSYKSCDFGVHLALNHREGEDSSPSCSLHPEPQAGSQRRLSSTTVLSEFMEHLIHHELHHDRTVGWSTEGATHRGPVWDTTLFILQDVIWCFESLSTQMGHLLSRWSGTCLALESAEAKGMASPLLHAHPHRHLASRLLDFDLCCLELWVSKEGLFPLGKTTVVPRRQKLKVWSFYH